VVTFDEARLKHQVLVADAQKIARRAEWEQISRLDRLERAVELVRARLGLMAARSGG